MAVYIITGNLGSGKSLCAMGKMRDYLWENKKVATNVNVHVENLVSGKAKRDIIRTPDHPSSEFLWDKLGLGGESKLESGFGMLLIDEVGTWLNSREWKGSDRQKVIEWFIHSRKRRWNCYLIAQSVNMIDKQIREAIGEHIVLCARADRFGIPFVGFLFSQLGLNIRLPQIHMAKVYYAAGKSLLNAPVVDRWVYSGRDLWGSYDTGQRFSADNDGMATMLDPHTYQWLQKPSSFTLDMIEVCKSRRWQRLERVFELLHTQTPAERGYRLLQLWQEYGNAITRPMDYTFDHWAEKVENGEYGPSITFPEKLGFAA